MTRTRSLIVLAMGIIAAVAVGYLNTHTDESLVVLPAVVALTGILGLLSPRSAWRWALLIGLAVPLSQLIFLALNLHVPYPNGLADIPPSLLAVIPAVAGAYLGVVVSGMLAQLRNGQANVH
jgi:hypothetical protein